MDFPFYITWSAQQNAAHFSAERSEGSRLFLKDGSDMIDMSSTSGQANFGHSNKIIIEKLKQQLDLMPIASPKAVHPLKTSVSKRLINLLSQDGGKIFYTVSGAEAVENALKMARQIKDKTIVLSRKVSYHGASLGAMSVSGDWRRDENKTLDDWTVFIPEPGEDPDLSLTRKIIESTGPENIAAFCLETITGANGVVIPDRSWWAGIQALAKEFCIFLILDEVFAGFGRTGKPFAFQHFALKPDFVTMSKGMSGGYIPFGAVWTGEAVSSFYQKQTLSCGLTNYAHPLGLAALDGVIEQLQDGNYEQQYQVLKQCFSEELEKIKGLGVVKEVRHIGLLAAIELRDIEVDYELLFRHGIYLLPKPKLLVIAPSLVMTIPDLQDGFSRLTRALTERVDNEAK